MSELTKEQKMLKDLAICMRDGISLDTLCEDINEAEEDYGYSVNQLLQYLSTLKNT